MEENETIKTLTNLALDKDVESDARVAAVESLTRHLSAGRTEINRAAIKALQKVSAETTGAVRLEAIKALGKGPWY